MENTDIITIYEEQGDFPVNGRELHEKLGIESNYTTWFKRMCEYGFLDQTDYQVCFPNLESDSRGGQNKIDHQLSLSMAKELCMLQRTEQGRTIRRYLLSIEEAWNTPEKVLARALQVANNVIANFKDEVKALSEKNAEMLPKAVFYDAVTGSDDTIDMAQAAKVLNMGVGRNTLFKLLREKNVLQSNNIPYQQFIDKGYFRCIESKYDAPDGSTHISIKTVVFQKGLDFIRATIENNRTSIA
jgi:anti-repressor protein